MMDYLVLSEFLKRVEFTAKPFFWKFMMDKRVTGPADPDPSVAHVCFSKLLSEPFIAMAGSGDEMVKGNKTFTPTECALFVHTRTPAKSWLLADILAQTGHNRHGTVQIKITAQIKTLPGGAASHA